MMTNAFRIYQSMFIFFSIYLIVYICQNWVFRPDRDVISTMEDERQKMFETWLDIELLVVYTNILGAIFYTLVRSLK